MLAIEKTFSKDLFEGKTVLVSGGSSGIGLEIARGFAAHGADVIATGSSEEKLSQAPKDPANKGIKFAKLDVRDRAATKTFAASLDKLDILINCQGIVKPMTEWGDEDFADVVDVNLNSMMRLSNACHPLLVKSKGSVICIASMLSFLQDPGAPAYTSSKSGILGLVRVLAHGWGSDGVRVNAIAPGYHRTEMTRVMWETPEIADKFGNHAALKRWGEAEDVVGAALFLSSPAANFITGVTLPVDGGYVSGNVYL